MKVLAVLALIVVASQARPSSNKANLQPFVGRIIGGEDAAPGAWPWQASLQRCTIGCSHSCGAVVVNENWVLTAAHCIQNPDPSGYRVVAGLHRRSDESGAQPRDASQVISHPEFIQDGSLGFPNDVGVVRVSSAFDLSASNVAAATLVPSNAPNFAGQACTISGWGLTVGGGSGLPDVLQQADTRVLSTADCQAQGIPQADDDYHICINDDDLETSSCNGDSGGPLNCPVGANGAYQVAGITSFGIIFCPEDTPAGYARVSTYRQWIDDNISA
ncbi:DgyrCDS2150 [Dimorphilus gyrociliatus]|uniref:DgyrCDS2150 n=1 Tax=Dimorphilus gyrociliatus TaxID=2664684 RepID=A0A7I8VC71_9ANNE|nr:DgyrCDS2150 [Dimorphilus gyrociliatus]